MEHLPEFIENCQYGKQIDEFLDIKKTGKNVPRPQNLFFGHLKVQNVQKVDFFENVRSEAMYAIVFYVFFKNMPYVTFGGGVTFACFS